MSHVVAAVLLVALASFLAAHAATLGLLAFRRPRYRALAALAVPPLAPYYAWRAGQRAAVYVWIGAVAVYAVGVGILGR